MDRETLRFLEVNAAAVAQYGYSRKELLAMRTTDIRPPEEIARYKKAMLGTGIGTEAQGCWWHRRKNGTLFEVEAISEGIVFSGRDAVLVVAQDLTARRKAEHAIAEHNAYLQALLQNLPLAVMIIDKDLRVQSVAIPLSKNSSAIHYRKFMAAIPNRPQIHPIVSARPLMLQRLMSGRSRPGTNHALPT